MKALTVLFAGAAMLFATSVRAQTNDGSVNRFKNATIEQTEKSLVLALESNSPGVQLSAAQTVRELKALYPSRSFSMFVIPLMALVKNEEESPSTRVLAAIALHELHSARGAYAIAQTAKFTDCARLKHTCEWLAYYQWLDDHPDIAAKDHVLSDYPAPIAQR
jgi:hypothetical protein